MDILSGVVALMRAVFCPLFEVAGDRHLGGGVTHVLPTVSYVLGLGYKLLWLSRKVG